MDTVAVDKELRIEVWIVTISEKVSRNVDQSGTLETSYSAYSVGPITNRVGAEGVISGMEEKALKSIPPNGEVPASVSEGYFISLNEVYEPNIPNYPVRVLTGRGVESVVVDVIKALDLTTNIPDTGEDSEPAPGENIKVVDIL